MYRYVSMILHKLLDLKVFPDENYPSVRRVRPTNLNPKLIFTPLPLASPPPAHLSVLLPPK